MEAGFAPQNFPLYSPVLSSSSHVLLDVVLLREFQRILEKVRQTSQLRYITSASSVLLPLVSPESEVTILSCGVGWPHLVELTFHVLQDRVLLFGSEL